jgi:Uma2 family endonuclease
MGMAISVPRYTIEDLERFPHDGNRYELLDGVLLVTPAPAPSHQIIASRIQSRLSQAVEWSGHAHVVAPGAVVRAPDTQLQPDLLVYPARFSPNTDWRRIDEHWLAVEIFSPSSRIYDHDFKRDAYFALGVQQMWLVDGRDKTVELCCQRGTGDVVRDRVRWRVPTVDLMVSLSLREIFAGIE